MKNILLLLFVFIIIEEAAYSQPFKIVESTSMQWVGGRKESGKGTNYNFKIVPLRTSKKLTFKKIWIDTLCFEVDELVNTKFQPVTSFVKNDTIIIRVSFISGGENIQTLPSCKPVPALIKTKKNLVEYKYKNKISYQPIRNLKILDKQYRK